MNGRIEAEDALLSPRAFVHAVLRTSPESFPSMTGFYKKFLAATPAYENDFISFLRYDEEHHRIAVVAIPHTAPKNPKACGLDHLAFAFDTLRELVTFYQQKRVAGIHPIWCVNHGPTTSIYYQDPDGNKIETQVDNMDSDSANAFMYSEAFAKNPIGADFDPDELIRRIESGEDEASIKKRPDVGPRDVDGY